RSGAGLRLRPWSSAWAGLRRCLTAAPRSRWSAEYGSPTAAPPMRAPRKAGSRGWQSHSAWSDNPLSGSSQRHLEQMGREGFATGGGQPVGRGVLIGQRQARAQALVAVEKLPHEVRAVALAAAVQKHDMLRQAAAALILVEDLAHRLEALLIGQVPAPAHDPLLEETWPAAGPLHLRVVVALDRQHIQAAKALDQLVGHVTE